MSSHEQAIPSTSCVHTATPFELLSVRRSLFREVVGILFHLVAPPVLFLLLEVVGVLLQLIVPPVLHVGFLDSSFLVCLRLLIDTDSSLASCALLENTWSSFLLDPWSSSDVGDDSSEFVELKIKKKEKATLLDFELKTVISTGALSSSLEQLPSRTRRR